MKKMNLRKIAALVFALGLVGAVSPSARAALSFSGTSGNLAAEVDFALSGSTLTVTLINTSTHDVLVPSDVLTGVFFNTTHTLTPVSASLGGSAVFYGNIVNVGNGWGYASGVSAQGKNSAISASGAVSGLGHNNFTAANNPLQGIDYGILSHGDNPLTGNGGVTGGGPLVKNEVVFTLTAASGFTLSEIGNSVVFQYGTSLTEPHPPGTPVPEASTVFAGLLLLLPLGASTIRILRKRQAV